MKVKLFALLVVAVIGSMVYFAYQEHHNLYNPPTSWQMTEKHGDGWYRLHGYITCDDGEIYETWVNVDGQGWATVEDRKWPHYVSVDAAKKAAVFGRCWP